MQYHMKIDHLCWNICVCISRTICCDHPNLSLDFLVVPVNLFYYNCRTSNWHQRKQQLGELKNGKYEINFELCKLVNIGDSQFEKLAYNTFNIWKYDKGWADDMKSLKSFVWAVIQRVVRL